MAVFEPSTPYENRSKPMNAARKRLLSALLDDYEDSGDGTLTERVVALEEAVNATTTGILDRLDAIEARLDALETPP